MFREHCALRLRLSCIPKTTTTPFRPLTKLFNSELPRATQFEDLYPTSQLVGLIEDPILQNIDFEDLDNAVIADSEPVPKQRKKRGVKKGSKMTEENKLAISKAMKGKNKYERTELHRSRVGRTMRKRWAERKALGKQRKPIQCSVCGEFGHNKQTCPHTPPSAKTKHKMPQTFEHRWKITAVKNHCREQKQKQKQNKSKLKTKRVVKCGYCGQPGHNKRSCPELKKALAKEKKNDVESKVKKNNQPIKEKKSSLAPKIKMSDVQNLKSLYTVPLDVSTCFVCQFLIVVLYVG